MKLKRIIISRTDSIGDVVLSLPLAGYLKKYLPDTHIIFLGASYTRDVVSCSENIDEFICWDDVRKMDEKQQIQAMQALKADLILHVFPKKEIAKLARKAGIALRRGSIGRLYHWGNCNQLVRLSRKNSSLHEAQLNIALVKGLLNTSIPKLEEIPSFYGFNRISVLREDLKNLIDKDKFNLILHPKSKGSAREWGLENYASLLKLIPRDKFKIFITGTKAEGDILREEGFFKILDEKDEHAVKVLDMTGQMSLQELISFINAIDGLVAASTGPLHIAAALEKITVGIYPPIRPMHPGRWAPLGEKASFLVLDKQCDKCRKNGDCECIRQISPEQVMEKLMKAI